jgi:hypothetical protein
VCRACQIAYCRSVLVAKCNISSLRLSFEICSPNKMTRYCQHGKRRNECKDCKGSGICIHGKRRTRCPHCLGSCICEHGRIRSQCHFCCGTSFCLHGKRKHYCRQCKSSSFCPHGRRKGTKCKECFLAAVCDKRRCSLFVNVQLGEQQKLMKLLGEKFDAVVLDTFISGSSAKIFVSNLVCICEGQWLNSETINVYVLMIEAAAKSAARNIASFSSLFVTKIETEVMQCYTFDMCGDAFDM